MKISILQIMLLVFYALGMAIGQILFKQSSSIITTGLSPFDALIQILLNKWMLAALTLYALLTVYWVWLLSFIPLSIAYPFVVLSILAATLMSNMIYGEVITVRYFIGLVLLLAGVVCIVKE